MDIQLCNEHLTYSVVIYIRHRNIISGYSALLSKMLKKVSMNILDITAEYLDFTTKYIRCLSNCRISRYLS